MKNILVLVYGDQGQASRLQCAFDAVRALGGHLYCLEVVNFPVAVAGEYKALSSGFIFKDETERLEKNRERVEVQLKAEGVPYSWLEDHGDFADSIRRHSHLIDLIVLNTLPYDTQGGDLYLLSRLVMKQDLPVLAVPEGVTSFDPTGPAIVAWDNAPSSNEALRAALPLLALASDVYVVSISEHGGLADPGEAAAYLSRHDIGAETKSLSSSGASISQQILAESEATQTTLCVMGAYDHAPLRERLLGGTTERVLKYSNVPLLLAHED